MDIKKITVFDFNGKETNITWRYLTEFAFSNDNSVIRKIIYP